MPYASTVLVTAIALLAVGRAVASTTPQMAEPAVVGLTENVLVTHNSPFSPYKIATRDFVPVFIRSRSLRYAEHFLLSSRRNEATNLRFENVFVSWIDQTSCVFDDGGRREYTAIDTPSYIQGNASSGIVKPSPDNRVIVGSASRNIVQPYVNNGAEFLTHCCGFIGSSGRQSTCLDNCSFSPRSTILHLVQLTFHGVRLSLHNGQLINRGPIRALTTGPHFTQLPIENAILRHANADGGGRRDSNGPSGSGRASGSAIGGVLLSLLGAALMAVALNMTDTLRNPAWLVGFAWGTGLVASAVIYQGTILILTGHWLP